MNSPAPRAPATAARLETAEVRAALLAQAAALRAQAEVLETLADGVATFEPNALLDLGELQRNYHLGRAAIRKGVEQGELTASRGARGRILVRRTDIEAWIASRPMIVAARASSPEATAFADWDRAQDRELARATNGAATRHSHHRSERV